MKYWLILFFASLLIKGVPAWAQEQTLDDQEVISIENLYKNNPPPAPAPGSGSLPLVQQPDAQGAGAKYRIA